MTEPTDQPLAGPSAPPAAATRREARLRREAQEASPLLGPSLAAPVLAEPLVVPRASSGAPLAETLALPLAVPVEPPSAAPAAPRRRAVIWLSAAAVLLGVGLGAAWLWFPRTAHDDASDASHGQDISAAANPVAERGRDGGGPTPTHTAGPTAPPATSIPPVETVVAPAPDAPSADAPSPDGDPGSTPPQSAPAPDALSPTAPQSPAAPTPLAFTGITPNQTIGLLGIRILSSYTLTLSGRPGSTATVTYDGSPAGSVTFDGSGRASITVGAGALDLGIGDPLITAAYSDGTPGAPIQARRSAI